MRRCARRAALIVQQVRSDGIKEHSQLQAGKDQKNVPNSKGSQEHTQQQEKSKSIANRRLNRTRISVTQKKEVEQRQGVGHTEEASEVRKKNLRTSPEKSSAHCRKQSQVFRRIQRPSTDGRFHEKKRDERNFCRCGCSFVVQHRQAEADGAAPPQHWSHLVLPVRSRRLVQDRRVQTGRSLWRPLVLVISQLLRWWPRALQRMWNR